MEFQKYAIALVYALDLWACLANGLEDYFYHLQTFEDTVGAGNYTNFKLTGKGNIHIHLQTLEGDADMYVSQTNQKPTFEDYDLKAVTCGEDHVDIPESFQRPTAIAIYGHPSFDESRFRCSVFVDRRELPPSEYDHWQPSEDSIEEEHPGWLFVLKVLEFILDVAI